MLYLKSNQSNEIVVTWTERMTNASALFIVFELTSISENKVYDYTILKSSNLSIHMERFDKYTFAMSPSRTGQYTYTAYESINGTNKIAVLETGLAYIQTAEQAFVSATNSITYAEPIIGTFDFTFDLTFN